MCECIKILCFQLQITSGNELWYHLYLSELEVLVKKTLIYLLHQYVCSRHHETIKMCILLVEITLKENLISSWHKVSMNLVILVHPTRLRILFIGRFSIVTQERFSKFYLHCSKLRDVSRLKSWVSRAIMQLWAFTYASVALEVLELNLNFFIKTPPSGICFPSVKILHVSVRNHMIKSWLRGYFLIVLALEVLKIRGYSSHWT